MNTTHPGPDLTGHRVHRNKTGLFHLQMIFDGIQRGHDGVFFPFVIPGKNLHRYFNIKRSFYLFITQPVFFQVFPAVGFFDCFLQQFFTSFPDRSVFHICTLVDPLLQHGHVLRHAFFGILLHLYINRGIDLQPVIINTVFATIRFLYILEGFLYFIFQYFPEIRRITGIFIQFTVIEFNMKRFCLLGFSCRDLPVFLHLAQYGVPSVQGQFGITLRIVNTITFQHPHQ